MEVLRSPKGFDHQERSVGVFEERVKITGTGVEAANEWFCSFRDKCIEGGPSSRKSFDGMAFGQNVFGKSGADPAGRTNHGNTDGLSHGVVRRDPRGLRCEQNWR